MGDEGTCNKARSEAEGLLGNHQQLGHHCHQRSEEDWNLHCPWPLPHQDPREARHEGRCSHDVRCGTQSEGKGCKDCCEGLPSGCAEEADLQVLQCVTVLLSSRGAHTVGIPQCRLGRLRGQLVSNCTCVAKWLARFA